MTRFSRRAVLGARAFLLVARPTPANAEEACLDRLLARRRMVRRFRPDPVSEAGIRRVIAAAVRAPSAGHTQPWEFIVVRERSTREALARAAREQAFVAEAPVVVVASTDVARSRARYGARGERYALVDGAFAALCLLLAVAEDGLGACRIGACEGRGAGLRGRGSENVR